MTRLPVSEGTPGPRHPFAAGSVSLGLHRGEGDGPTAVADLVAQARAAAAAGFDGVTMSEHHGDHPGYLPVPTLLIAILLGAVPELWGAPAPTILPLRSRQTVLEELSWLAAAFPGRVGAAVVAGYQRRDFDLLGADFGTRSHRLWADLPWLAAGLRGRAGGAGDAATRGLSDAPVPVLAGVGGPRGAARAAAAGAGLLLTSLTSPERSAALGDHYAAAGGEGPVVLVRRAWLGDPPDGLRAQLQRYAAADESGRLHAAAGAESIASGETPRVADRLANEVAASGATAVNLRLFAEGVSRERLVEQVEMAGAHVLPVLRAALVAGPPSGPAAARAAAGGSLGSAR